MITFHPCRLSGGGSHCKKRHTVNVGGLWGWGLVPVASSAWKKVRQGRGSSTFDSCPGLCEFIHHIPGASVSNINSASFHRQLPPRPPARGLSTWIQCSVGCWQRHSQRIYRPWPEGFSQVVPVWRFFPSEWFRQGWVCSPLPPCRTQERGACGRGARLGVLARLFPCILGRCLWRLMGTGANAS